MSRTTPTDKSHSAAPRRLRSGCLILLCLLPLLAGCDTVLMRPSGDVAAQEGRLIVISTVLMLLIIVPVIVLTVVFAWRYRQQNREAVYEPDWHHSTPLELVIWGAPLLIIIVLGLITWVSTHLLDPYRPLQRLDATRAIAAGTRPLTVEVVALDWKWLFIYPEQGIASVNELVIPLDVPVHYRITASSFMNSFFVPALAGQIYAMAGMETTLNAVINQAGVYEGFSANYSGAGFSYMRFKLHGVSTDDFARWTANVKSSGAPLDRASYLQLAKPSLRDPVRHYTALPPDLYHAILNRCVVADSVCLDQVDAADMHRAMGHVHPAATP